MEYNENENFFISLLKDSSFRGGLSMGLMLGFIIADPKNSLLPTYFIGSLFRLSEHYFDRLEARKRREREDKAYAEEFNKIRLQKNEQQ